MLRVGSALLLCPWTVTPIPAGKGHQLHRVTSMGFTVMVRAESSQSISFSLPVSWSRIVLWCAARIRNTPRMIMNTRKLTQTTITTVAVLGTTATRKHNHGNSYTVPTTTPHHLPGKMALYKYYVYIIILYLFQRQFVYSHLKSQWESKN